MPQGCPRSEATLDPDHALLFEPIDQDGDMTMLELASAPASMRPAVMPSGCDCPVRAQAWLRVQRGT